jgi:hypothetical protein
MTDSKPRPLIFRLIRVELRPCPVPNDVTTRDGSTIIYFGPKQPVQISLGEGMDAGPAVDFTYKLPFKFTGSIDGHGRPQATAPNSPARTLPGDGQGALLPLVGAEKS